MQKTVGATVSLIGSVQTWWLIWRWTLLRAIPQERAYFPATIPPYRNAYGTAAGNCNAANLGSCTTLQRRSDAARARVSLSKSVGGTVLMDHVVPVDQAPGAAYAVINSHGAEGGGASQLGRYFAIVHHSRQHDGSDEFRKSPLQHTSSVSNAPADLPCGRFVVWRRGRATLTTSCRARTSWLWLQWAQVGPRAH